MDKRNVMDLCIFLDRNLKTVPNTYSTACFGDFLVSRRTFATPAIISAYKRAAASRDSPCVLVRYID